VTIAELKALCDTYPDDSFVHIRIWTPSGTHVQATVDKSKCGVDGSLLLIGASTKGDERMSDWPEPIPPPDHVQQIADSVGGTIDECALLPDGSGFATMSMPLPANHWLHAPGDNVPPMPFRMGQGEHATIVTFPNRGYPDRSRRMTRQEFAEHIRAAARYALRASTMNGREPDYDPDAVLQNLVVGLLGYWTATGLSNDPEANPT